MTLADRMKELDDRDLLEPARTFASAHGATVEEMFSGSRLKHVAAARHAFTHWLVRELGWSSTAVGRLFRQNHSTVLAAVAKVEGRTRTARAS